MTRAVEDAWPRLDTGAWWDFVSARAAPGVEVLDERTVRRVVRTPAGPRPVSVTVPASGVVVVRADPLTRPAVRRWLGADLDLAPARAALVGDPVLGPLLRARPDLAVPGAADPAELALRTVLGQQVSLAAANTVAGRLAAMLGERVQDLVAFPTPAAVAGAGDRVGQIGLTGARTRALLALAGALADGLDLTSASHQVRADLLALPGIGPWTVEYVALRGLRDLDAFPAHDLVLRRRMGVQTAREALVMAERWRPWRGLAAQLLWTG